MKVGIFWFGNYTPEIGLAIEELYANRNKGVSLDVSLYSIFKTAHSRQIMARQQVYPHFRVVNDIITAFEESVAGKLDFAIISFGNAIFLSLKKMQLLLEDRRICNAIFSFRISDIKGVGFKFSPRLPYVDDNFIILNVNLAKEKNFFSRKLINASHFIDAGANHAVLMSFIEYSINKDEIFNYFEHDSFYNEYAMQLGLITVPFSICKKTGFATCYSQLNSTLWKLITINALPRNESLGNIWISEKELLNYINKQLIKTDNYYFFKRKWWLVICQFFVSKLRSHWGRFNFEVSKKYR